MNLEDLVLRSDNKILETNLNAIRSCIKSTKMLSSSTSSAFSSTTRMPSGVPEIVSTYMPSTTNLLSKLANETSQFEKIGDAIDEMNFKLERQVDEIEEPLEIEKIDEKSEEETKMPVTILPIVTDKEEKTEPLEKKTEPVEEKTGTTKEQQTTPSTTPKEETLSNKQTTYSNTSSKSASSNAPSQQTTPKEIEPAEALQEFPEYDKVVSDDNKLVFQNDQGYKLIIHKENNVINGVEHYYDLGSQENSLNTIESIKTSYQGNEYLKQVIQDGQYIKVIFETDVYKNYDINTITNPYEQLDGYNKI